MITTVLGLNSCRASGAEGHEWSALYGHWRMFVFEPIPIGSSGVIFTCRSKTDANSVESAVCAKCSHFKLDKGTTDCAAGSYVYYYGISTDDLKAMYAAAVASFIAGTPVIVHYKNGCVIDGLAMGT